MSGVAGQFAVGVDRDIEQGTEHVLSSLTQNYRGLPLVLLKTCRMSFVKLNLAEVLNNNSYDIILFQSFKIMFLTYTNKITIFNILFPFIIFRLIPISY